MPARVPRAVFAPLVLALVGVAAPARAQSLAPHGSIEDAIADGDVDAVDPSTLRIGAPTAAGDLTDGTWVSLFGFTQQSAAGATGFGAGLLVGVAFDRIAAGPTHVLADPVRPPVPLSAADATVPQPAREVAAVPPRFARECVAAALRASGLGVDDARLDDIVDRARASAWLPETRMRAERVWNDSANVSAYAPTDPTNYYDAIGSNFLLELRLTWRLDRLLYAGDEPLIERVRLQRQFERTRLATQVLEVLFAWRRAERAAADAPAQSRERYEAESRAAEGRATLDVLTAGWFSARQDGI